ncbi:MAG: cell division protein FtsA [Candidatus Andersenbacteria bacterium RIFCSPHIGHO2_12_FULL_46_9]|nr:MAG: Cell division protein ftsA [Parcubacteria group bacterium GW2011_GWA2_45_14]OGY34601.1 MAG: cell division protein FtsA [Candidatus Andersenbacteria bacterium RIFCSPHIGHO2_02_FULL_46_16]OGY36392.1 MAG: cell division protein FtsA [Candidatus Andersenbacteria bacterium RIFCSPHIGHO2_12_FULL_46_9]OGY37888.1 MAG: cell division protein FtsA [Candidatus Andersenbacteria bacterium RIFCSPLOWO2_02_FULL_46_11]HBE89942.1 cell division protein FtsA [Candidatus Andersenbacteria bacterium]
MAQAAHITGIDLGSSVVRVVVAQVASGSDVPIILGVGKVEMDGMQKGVVSDVDDAVKSVSAALDMAERVAGVPIDRAYVSINGSHISSQNSRGVIAVSRADGEITEEDVDRVINAAQAVSLPSNREILHVLPQNFVVDGHEHIKDPVGMTGVRLEVETHMVDGSTPFIKNITKVINQSGVHIEDFVFSPLAAATAVLDKKQKELGVVLVDLGAGTSSLIVYEENMLLDTAVLPLGSAHVTNDIAIGLRTSIEVAEQIKKQYGTALAETVKKSESIMIDSESEQDSVSRKEVADIISARLDEIYSFVDKELKSIGRSGLLPAGVIFTGGGASLPGVIELAKNKLRLPAKVGTIKPLEGLSEQAGDPAYAVVVGLILWAMEQEKSTNRRRSRLHVPDIKVTVSRVRSWFKSFMP